MPATTQEPVRVAEVSYTQLDDHRLRRPAKFRRCLDRDADSCRLDQLDTDPPPVGELLAG